MAKRKSAPSASKSGTRAAVAPRPDDWGIARHLSWWTLLALVFITPIIISNLTFMGFRLPISYDQFDIIKVFVQRVLGGMALAFWAWEMLTRGGKIRRTPVDILIVVFLVWVAFSTIFSVHPPTAFFGKYRRFEGLASFLNYAVLYFLVLQLADRPARLKRLAQSIFWSGAVVCFYGVMQYFGKDILAWGTLPFEANRAFSTYGNPDLLGGFLMFSLFVSLGLAFAEKNLVMRGVYWGGVLLSAMCTIVAFTRSAWVGSMAGLVFFIVIAVMQRTKLKTEDWVFGGGALAAAIVPAVISLNNPSAVMNFGTRVVSIFDFRGGSALTRLEIWSAAWRAILARPIFGFGPDTFRLIFPRYKPIEYVRDAGYLSVADNVHNYPLQLATGVGIPGVVMLYGILGWAAARSWKLVTGRDGESSRMVLTGFWVACAAYVAHLLFGLSVTGSSFLLWVSMAAVLSPTATSFDFRPPTWGIAVAVFIVALSLASSWYHVRFMQADHQYLLARIGSTGAARTAYAQEAMRLNPNNDMYRAEVGLALTDEVLDTINSGISGQMNQTAARATAFALFGRAESSLKDTIDFVPWEYDNYVFMCNLYNLAGEYFGPQYYQNGIEIGEKGIKVEPFGPAMRFQLARCYLGANQPEKAIEHLAYANRMDPAYTDVTTLLADVLRQSGRLEEAVKMLEETREKMGVPGVLDSKLDEYRSLLASQQAN